ncbi:MAG TPA: DUF6292 family protein [Pseudonocardiaceae bacterium]|nr:DUF6292 family protein [Pseudonocardiaceae bacterium]
MNVATSSTNRPPRSSISWVAEYLDDVADELDRRGFAIDSVEMIARAPLSGRLSIAEDSGTPGQSASAELRWREDDGWVLGRKAPTGERPWAWRRISGEAVADPATVADFLLCG